MVFLALLDPIQVLNMFNPGAIMSTHFPKFEKVAFLSSTVLAATVIADGSEAGATRLEGRSWRPATAPCWLRELMYPSHFRPVDLHLRHAGFSSSHLTRLALLTR